MFITILLIILLILSLLFSYSIYRFIKHQKATISYIESGVTNYFDKYCIQTEQNEYIESLNMDSLDSNFNHRSLLAWIGDDSLKLVNSSFEDDIGSISIPLSSIKDIKLVQYSNSDKKDIYLDFLNSDSDVKTIYFKGEYYAALKSLVSG